ncbi:hypothetical protein GCM10010244_33010 [Streptomyces coeruleorubidus]|nr:hypothetical protein GCM10010244_33010 [Streptomyces bellus]
MDARSATHGGVAGRASLEPAMSQREVQIMSDTVKPEDTHISGGKDGDIKPLDTHISSEEADPGDVKPLDTHISGGTAKPLDTHISDEKA